MESEYYRIQESKLIPYGEETYKRTFKEKCVKVRNTLCQLLAYACPNNNLRVYLHRSRGVNIGRNVYLGMYLLLDNLYPTYIYIEDNASILAKSTILTHFNPSKRLSQLFEAKVSPVLIKEGAVVAVNSVVLPGTEIGKYAIVSAGSVVSNVVEEYTIVRGNPAKRVVKFPKSLIIK